MHQLKRFFISFFLAYLALALMLSAWQLVTDSAPNTPAIAWFGSLLSNATILFFFVALFLRKPARTSEHPLPITLLSATGVIVTMMQSQGSHQQPGTAFWLAAIGFIAWIIYLRWYSRSPTPSLPHLKPGKNLPGFQVIQGDGQVLTSQECINKKYLWLFYRGNWCPLCMGQVQEVAAQWRELDAMGVEIMLVSPQPQTHTQALAERFKTPMTFLHDPHNQAAQRLGIAAPGSLPFGLELLGYEPDVVLPTIIISDEQGKIRYAHISDNYRVRPEPKVLIDRLRSSATQETEVNYH